MSDDAAFLTQDAVEALSADVTARLRALKPTDGDRIALEEVVASLSESFVKASPDIDCSSPKLAALVIALLRSCRKKLGSAVNIFELNVAVLDALTEGAEHVSTPTLDAYTATLKSRVDHIVQIVKDRQTHSGIQARSRDGLDSVAVHDMGPPSFFVDRPPPLLPFDQSVRKIDLARAVEQLAANRPVEYLQCLVCRRLTSDSPEEHRRTCVKSDILPSRDASGNSMQPMSLDAVLELCTKVVVDDVTGLEQHMPFLTAYTLETPIYRQMNAMCRSVHDPVVQKEFEERYGSYFVGVCENLRFLPPYSGTVYRGLDFEVPREYYTPGSVITWPALSSSSASASEARKFLGKGLRPSGTLFVIQSKTGRSVKAFSNIPEEEEVLFPPGSQFRVVREMEAGLRGLLQAALQVILDDVLVYEMEEVLLRTQDSIVTALSPDQRDRWSAPISKVFSSKTYVNKVEEYARGKNYLIDRNPVLTYRAKVDGEVRLLRHLPVNEVWGTSLLVDAVVGCEPAVLKVVMGGLSPTTVPPVLARRWVQAFLSDRSASESNRIAPSPTAAWLISWAEEHGRDIFADADEWFLLESAVALAGCPSSAVHAARVKSKLLPRLIHTPSLRMERLLKSCLERGSAEVFEWLTERTVGPESSKRSGKEVLESMSLVVARGDGQLRKAPALTAAILRARVSPDEAPAFVKVLLKLGMDVTATDGEGGQPILYAAEMGAASIMSMLLEADGVEVDARGKEGRTPLMVAAGSGSVAVMKQLLNANADPNATSDDGSCPLLYAAQNGNIKGLQLLRHAGADPDVADKNGVAALYMASDNGHDAAVQMILEWLEQKNLLKSQLAALTRNRFTALHVAARNGHASCVRLLLENGADRTTAAGDGRTALHAAAAAGYLDVVKELLVGDGEAEVDVASTEDGHTALSLAAMNGQLEVVRLLLLRGASATATLLNGRTVLQLAQKCRSSKVVQLVTEHLQAARGPVEADLSGGDGSALARAGGG